MVRFDDSVMMVRNLLGQDNYAILIADLPDEFFQLTNDQKRIIFRAIQHAINKDGERNPAKLVEVVHQFMDQMIKSTVNC